jgi:hypothetical protein
VVMGSPEKDLINWMGQAGTRTFANRWFYCLRGHPQSNLILGWVMCGPESGSWVFFIALFHVEAKIIPTIPQEI